MDKIFEKTRAINLHYELEREYSNLKIAEASFRHIKTPHPISLTKDTLYTKKMPGHDSIYYKRRMPTELLLDEYTKIINLLSIESLNTTQDLTPEWVKNPTLKMKKNLHPDFQNLSPDELRKILERKPKPAKDFYGVVHGDLCPVNIIMDGDIAYGLVDLGDMHMGDRRLDIAILSWTIRGNFGLKIEQEFMKRIEKTIDPSIIQYYRLIYDLSLPDYKNWDWIKE